MAARPAPKPKGKSGGARPAGKHSLTGGRNFGRVAATQQNNDTGAGTGASPVPS